MSHIIFTESFNNLSQVLWEQLMKKIGASLPNFKSFESMVEELLEVGVDNLSIMLYIMLYVGTQLLSNILMQKNFRKFDQLFLVCNGVIKD